MIFRLAWTSLLTTIVLCAGQAGLADWGECPRDKIRIAKHYEEQGELHTTVTLGSDGWPRLTVNDPQDGQKRYYYLNGAFLGTTVTNYPLVGEGAEFDLLMLRVPGNCRLSDWFALPDGQIAMARQVIVTQDTTDVYGIHRFGSPFYPSFWNGPSRMQIPAGKRFAINFNFREQVG